MIPMVSSLTPAAPPNAISEKIACLEAVPGPQQRHVPLGVHLGGASSTPAGKPPPAASHRRHPAPPPDSARGFSARVPAAAPEGAGPAVRPPSVGLGVGVPAYYWMETPASRGAGGREGGRPAGERGIDAARGGLGARRGQTLVTSELRASSCSCSCSARPGAAARHAPPRPRRRLRAAVPRAPAAFAAAAADAVERLRAPEREAKGAAAAEGGGGPGESGGGNRAAGHAGRTRSQDWRGWGVVCTAAPVVVRAPGCPALSESTCKAGPGRGERWGRGAPNGGAEMRRGSGGTPQKTGSGPIISGF